MSLESVEEKLHLFLTSQDAGVLIIRGEWGEGKTFFWKNHIELKYQNLLKRYAYVSLFGINSILEFKSSIFCETKPSRQQFFFNLKSMLNKCKFYRKINCFLSYLNKYLQIPPNRLDRMIKWFVCTLIYYVYQLIKGASKWIDTMPYMKVPEMLAHYSFMSISKTIICIDDVERKGEGLSDDVFLGLVNTLCDQKNCKVILIMSEKELNKENGVYKKYKEKVVDFEVNFVLSPKEAVDLVFPQGGLMIKSDIEQFASLLGISNIRILKKIKRLAEALEKILRDYHPEVLKKSLHSMMLFCYSHYSGSDDVPNLEFIMSPKNTRILSENDASDSDGKNREYLRKYNFLRPDEFDNVILDGVKQGYFDEGKLKIEAKKIDDRIQYGQSMENWAKAWMPFHASFKNNVDDVVSSLKDGYFVNYVILAPADVDALIRTLRKIDQNDLANKIIYHYIINKDHIAIKEYMEDQSGSVTDKNFLMHLNKITQNNTTKKSLKDVLISIAGGSYSNEDINVLKEATVEEYIDCLKSFDENSSLLAEAIRVCLRTEAKNKMEKCLTFIAQESKLNRVRIEKFNIKNQNPTS